MGVKKVNLIKCKAARRLIKKLCLLDHDHLQINHNTDLAAVQNPDLKKLTCDSFLRRKQGHFFCDTAFLWRE